MKTWEWVVWLEEDFGGFPKSPRSISGISGTYDTTLLHKRITLTSTDFIEHAWGSISLEEPKFWFQVLHWLVTILHQTLKSLGNQQLGKGLRVLENRGGKTRHSSIYLGVQYAGGKRLPNTDFDFLTLLQEQVLFRKNSSDMVDFFPKVNIFWKLFVLCFLNTLKEKFWSISLVTLISHVNKICFLNTRNTSFLLQTFSFPVTKIKPFF